MYQYWQSDFWSPWQRHREMGLRRSQGSTDSLFRNLYSSFLPSYSWDPITSVQHTDHGGIFNLEFSPDGSLLVAASERKSILVFDPLNHKLINSVNQAHNDCVNYARFLDSRMFATCSDDMTIALWDVRFLRGKIRSLKGHSNWVKNIEYSSSEGLLVTSGFDGSIYTWDINGYSEQEVQYQRVFHTNGLMRMRLTPDNSKMVICTTGGFIMIIHDLNFQTLAHDLQGFKPNMYRLMQMGNSPFPIAYEFNHLFTAQKNRVELISDFPEGNDAEVISSLQIHPQGWCVLSRNTSTEETSEWTCVHDIQETGNELRTEKLKSPYPFRHLPPPPRALCENCHVRRSANTSVTNTGNNRNQGHQSVELGTFNQSMTDRPVVHIQFNYGSSPSTSSSSSTVPSPNYASQNSFVQLDRLEEGNRRAFERAESENADENVHTSTESVRFGNIELRISRRRNHPIVTSPSPSSGNSDTAGLVQVVDGSNLSPAERRRVVASTALDVVAEERTSSVVPGEVIVRETPAFFIRTGSELGARTYLVLGPSRSYNSGEQNPSTEGESQSRENRDEPESSPLSGVSGHSRKIHQNFPRLTHFTKEPNLGRGFIKELCFSSDGRLVCSPYGYGVRLLGFNGDCSELSDCVPNCPNVLKELVTNMSHSNYVVSTKFSPVHSLLVSGCLSGKISFHQPVL